MAEADSVVEAVLLARTRRRFMRLTRLRIGVWEVASDDGPGVAEHVLFTGSSLSNRLFRDTEADDFARAADQLEELGWSGPAIALLRAAAEMSAADWPAH